MLRETSRPLRVAVVSLAALGLVAAVIKFWPTAPSLTSINPDSAAAVAADENKVAVKGYDVVAYFTEGRPTVGSKDLSYVWNDATWYFSNADNRASFAAEPERFAPQYGGYCASGLAKGALVSADPEAWLIVDGRLYLNYDAAVMEDFREHLPEQIARADDVWTGIQRTH
jgi:hypothetical protein